MQICFIICLHDEMSSITIAEKTAMATESLLHKNASIIIIIKINLSYCTLQFFYDYSFILIIVISLTVRASIFHCVGRNALLYQNTVMTLGKGPVVCLQLIQM